MFKKAPNIIFYDSIKRGAFKNTRVETAEGWCDARPEGFFGLFHRIKCAWLVFSGQCDALTWPQDLLTPKKMTTGHIVPYLEWIGITEEGFVVREELVPESRGWRDHTFQKERAAKHFLKTGEK